MSIKNPNDPMRIPFEGEAVKNVPTTDTATKQFSVASRTFEKAGTRSGVKLHRRPMRYYVGYVDDPLEPRAQIRWGDYFAACTNAGSGASRSNVPSVR